MINLIEINDIDCRRDGQGNIVGLTIDKWFNQLLKQKLELGSRLSELVYTNDLRGIGKTHELVEFAKKYGYAVVVRQGAESFKKEYDYQNIYNESQCARGICKLGNIDSIVIDEFVNYEQVKKNTNLRIVTGFINGITKYEKESANFNDRIINTLKEEMNELIVKTKRALENNDYGTYKNLVLAFKEVSRLIIDLQENPIK